MIKVHGGGGFPALNIYNYPRPVLKTWSQVEIPSSLRPPSFKPKGSRQPIVEGKLLWRELARIN